MPGVGSVAWSYMADRFLVAIAHCLFLHVCRPKLYTGKLQSLGLIRLRCYFQRNVKAYFQEHDYQIFEMSKV